MDQLIPIINKLQDVFAVVNSPHMLALPQIVVVGAQSSGKSSVLESLVGRDFLPRGTGIVTRRPLVLQLVHTTGSEEWGEFLHVPSAKFTIFDDIRVEIEQNTRDLAGENKGISDKPINLKIFSPNVLDITLVDLPGITKVPVGDQPPDIEIRIRSLIMNYIENPNSIILAISSANTDLANSDALKLAREVDPYGERTLGVITKIDLMDDGTDASDMLRGNVYPLRLGYVGVICRSQADINKNKPVDKHLQDEALYFKSHRSYSAIADKMGIPYLARKLNALLLNHIGAKLPQLKKNVNGLLLAVSDELSSYGDPLEGNREAQSMTLLHIIDKFVQGYEDTLEGRLAKNATEELQGGSRINYIFEHHYREALNTIDPFDRLTDQDIRTAIKNASGTKASLFIPVEAFELLVKKQIVKLREPSLQCLQFIFDELNNLLFQVDVPDMRRFEDLKEEVLRVVRELFLKCMQPCADIIEKLIEMELTYINTYHPDFIGANDALRAVQSEIDEKSQSDQILPKVQVEVKPSRPEPRPQQSGGLFSMIFGSSKVKSTQREDKFENGAIARAFEDIEHESTKLKLKPPPSIMRPIEELSRKELMETGLVKKLIESYFGIVRKNIGDLVPKGIITFLVNSSRKELHRELVKQLYKEDRFDALLREGNDIPRKRTRCMELAANLRKASEILNEIKEFKVQE